MNIIVCAKQVPNPEIPANKFKVDAAANRVLPPEGVPPVINPFDEQAVEAALRIKEKLPSKITVITMVSGPAGDTIKHALGMGADEGVVLSDKAFEGADSFSTAYVLSKAIQKLAPFDLILCGRQAADWDRGLTGSIIAENLGIPVVTLARKIEAADGKLRVERVLLGGYEEIELSPPAVITVSNELGQARLPSGFGLIAALRKKVPVWSAADIGVDASLAGASGSRGSLLKLFVPVHQRKCEIIGGENAPADLALKLKGAGLI